MKAQDIKTFITSGTIIVAIALYLIFGPEPPTESVHEAEEAAEELIYSSEKVAIPLEAAEKATGNKAQSVTYISANDGDTLNVKLDGKKERVRLLMVDTPEMNYDKDEPMPYAEEAKTYTSKLLASAHDVQLLFDKGPKTDKYDRLLAYVYIDGVLLQEALLSEGYAAMRYVNPPNNTLEDELRDVQAQAEKEGLNVWSIDGYVENNRFNVTK